LSIVFSVGMVSLCRNLTQLTNVRQTSFVLNLHGRGSHEYAVGEMKVNELQNWLMLDQMYDMQLHI